MEKIRAAIIGYGNIGRYTLEALLEAPDFEIAGVVRRDPTHRDDIPASIPVVASVDDLTQVDVAILGPKVSTPSTASTSIPTFRAYVSPLMKLHTLTAPSP